MLAKGAPGKFTVLSGTLFAFCHREQLEAMIRRIIRPQPAAMAKCEVAPGTGLTRSMRVWTTTACHATVMRPLITLLQFCQLHTLEQSVILTEASCGIAGPDFSCILQKMEYQRTVS